MVDSWRSDGWENPWRGDEIAERPHAEVGKNWDSNVFILWTQGKLLAEGVQAEK